jgi:hemerythrin
VTMFLKDWLDDHILTMDMEFGKFLNHATMA